MHSLQDFEEFENPSEQKLCFGKFRFSFGFEARIRMADISKACHQQLTSHRSMARRTRRTRIVSSSGNYGSSAVVPLATVSSASSISPASTPIPVASTNAVITVTQDSSGALTFEIFHPFGRLPLELRRKVWKATYPGRQHVALEPVCHSQADDDAKNG